ncbi:MAG: methionyl-tRNA formyltransferase [Phycisphaerae bacterium]|jgi:methionyl-tRNA formyltransferase|nr:methionyl-tRNA formyltransferase [Phycisphaerae bacterium]HJN72034.1 methionyl-tRNA formyltransferase [Phycisphaerales bacterium]
MRIIFLGSGEFGLPTLTRLHEAHEVQAVITAPPRTAGRNRKPRMTPIGSFAHDHNLPLIEPENINDPQFVSRIKACNAEAMIVIAFGQKLSREVIGNHFAINLHASLLPKWRGAAPINAAIVHGDEVSGVSVISLADRMDAGLVYGTRSINIAETEIAGELHDRLSALGPDLVCEVLEGDRVGIEQDESLVTIAPKLSRSDARLDLSEDAESVARKVRGFSPWPSCHLLISGIDCKILRAIPNTKTGNIGELMEDGLIATGNGSIQILELQPSGGRPMTWVDFCNGRQIRMGDMCEAVQ